MQLHTLTFALMASILSLSAASTALAGEKKVPKQFGKIATDCSANAPCAGAGGWWHWGEVGDSMCLRNSVPIREVKKIGIWDTHGLVKLKSPEIETSVGNSPGTCKGFHAIPDGAPLFVETIKGETRLYLKVIPEGKSDPVFTSVRMAPGVDKSHRNLWLRNAEINTEADYDYYLFLLDDNPNAGDINKRYWLELYRRDPNDDCNKDRPDHDGNLSPNSDPKMCPATKDKPSSFSKLNPAFLQIHSGSGGEPDHP